MAPPEDDPRAVLFAALLERWHREGGDPEALLQAHPEHATLFRRWWQHLSSAGELTPRHGEPGPGRRLGPYLLLAELGSGSQGSVHLAEDTRLRRRVALKVLAAHVCRPEAMLRFRREAEMASRLEHPGVCTVYETGEHDGHSYIAMRFVDGSTLAQRLATARAARETPAIRATLQEFVRIAEALHAAHEARLIHRDIKPGNLMIARDGQPVILDFGLAREASDGFELTRTGDLLGTPAYMSPEQLAPLRTPLDARTDVYSLGVTLFECLTLRRPFEAATQAQLYQQILLAPLPDPRSWNRAIDADLKVVLETALARDRDLRYGSANDLAEDLRRILSGQTIRARRPDPFTRTWRWACRRPGLAAGIAVTCLSLLLGTAVSLLLWLEARDAEQAMTRFADVVALREALAEEQELYPARPDRVPQMERWLRDKARPLLQRLPRHRARLLELAAQAAPYLDADRERDRVTHPEAPRLLRLRNERAELLRILEPLPPGIQRDYLRARLERQETDIAGLEREVQSRRTFGFADREQSYEHQTLAELVRGLEALAAAGGALAWVEERLAWALALHRTTIAEPAAGWQSSVEHARTAAVYGQQELRPQLGMVPLGPDPQTGLLEFAWLRSGTVPQRHEATGALQIGPESAIVLVLIPAGRFTMGAVRGPAGANSDPDAAPDESPTAELELHWFFLGRHEITRGQWARLSHGEHPGSAESVLLDPHPDVHPVTHVSWLDCQRLLEREGLCLPTEAQWEYALRAGTRTPYWTGDLPRSLRGAINSRDQSLLQVLNQGGRASPSDGYPFTAPVHELRPNRFGLHHMAGNVAEWCREVLVPLGPGGAARDPRDGERVAREEERHVVRGGSFLTQAASFRSAARAARSRDQRLPDLGVRACRRVE